MDQGGRKKNKTTPSSWYRTPSSWYRYEDLISRKELRRKVTNKMQKRTQGQDRQIIDEEPGALRTSQSTKRELKHLIRRVSAKHCLSESFSRVGGGECS